MIAKTSIILIVILLISNFYAKAQVKWNYDDKIALMLARQENKFIVVDFWATWCIPCQKMNSRLWENEKMNKYRDKFIFLKVNIDTNKNFASRFNANIIPRIIVIDASYHKLCDKKGFKNPETYFNLLDNIPTAPNELTLLLTDLSGSINKKIQSLYNLGKLYQEIAHKTKHQLIQSDIFKLSSSIFDKVISTNLSREWSVKASMQKMFNKSYQGKCRKVRKRINELNIDSMNSEIFHLLNDLEKLCKS